MLLLLRLTPSSIIHIPWAPTIGGRHAEHRGRHASWVSNLNAQVEQRQRKGQACSWDSPGSTHLQLSDDESQGKIQQAGGNILEHGAPCPSPESHRNCSSWSRSQRWTWRVCSDLPLLICGEEDGKWVGVVDFCDAGHLQTAWHDWGHLLFLLLRAGGHSTLQPEL